MRDLLMVSAMACLVLALGCSSSHNNDTDRDGIKDGADNCPSEYNPDQMASVGNATLLGDACDDEDADAVVDAVDNCPISSNSDQADTDGNGIGDVCEFCQKVSLVADISPGAQSSFPSSLHALDGMLYFEANDGISGEKLWAYDPSIGATIVSGSGASSPGAFTELNGKLFFIAYDDVGEIALWVYNPVDPLAGVDRVVESVPGSGGIHPGGIIKLDGKLYFFSDAELWVYNPVSSTISAEKVFDLNYGFTSASVLAAMDGKLYFLANDYAHTGWPALWAYDPANPLAGVLMVADINVTSHGGNYREHLVMGGKLYFFAFLAAGAGPPDLWAYDPATGASAIIDNAGRYPQEIAALNGKVYIARDESNTIWAYDPADPTAGTVQVISVGDDQNDENGDLTAIAGKLYFVPDDGEYGSELWVYDPAAPTAGATLVEDIVPGSGHSYPGGLTLLDNKLYFSATDGVHGRELWEYDPACLH